jgi:hypothetical protein
MSIPTGVWLAQLILAEQTELSTETIAIVRANVPEYNALSDDQLRAIFDQVYIVFTRALETDDIGPWRTYFQAALAARRQVGIMPAEMIATIEIVQKRVLNLAMRHAPPNSSRVTESRSILRATANRIRMIISELNLAYLTNPPSNPTEK